MSRERLTITLKDELLKALDSQIDGQRLRNRSHAIEYFLSKSLGGKPVKVLILAGGKAVYFASEKKDLPKAMVKIAGKPLLEQTLKRLKSFKFSEVVISVGEGGQEIKDYFGDGENLGIHISYVEQKSNQQGTAQALFEAKKVFGQETFLLLYGDVLSDIDYNDLVEFHRSQQMAICTMALCSVEAVKMWGLAKLQGAKIVEFMEKPKSPTTFSKLINAGIYMMEPKIFEYISESAKNLESDVFPRLAEEGRLSGYPFEGLWLDISDSAAYKQALREMTKMT